MSRIFIVEDDATHRNELVKLLSRYGYTGIVSDDFENIVLEVLSTAPDLIILDINLPYFDGFHICREIRKQSSVPIIILTSRSGEMDEIMGLEIGADDFIAKPFNPGVLIAHIAAVLKRSKGMTEDDLITCRGLKLDIAKKENQNIRLNIPVALIKQEEFNTVENPKMFENSKIIHKFPNLPTERGLEKENNFDRRAVYDGVAR